jgi:hypothetical protein
MGRQRREQWTAIDEEGPSRERISVERAMGRQRREQRTAMDEEGPSRERIGRERVMGRQRREQLTAIDEEGPSRERIGRERRMGRQAKGAEDGHRRGRVESRRYNRWFCADTSAPFPLMAVRG